MLKDGHSFVVHIVDPLLEMSEEIPLTETETEWRSSVDAFSEQISGKTVFAVASVALLFLNVRDHFVSAVPCSRRSSDDETANK